MATSKANESNNPDPNPVSTMMSALKNLPKQTSPAQQEVPSFNGNFEQWFATDEYIPRPKLVEIEDNKDKMDTARKNLQKKLKRQEQLQQQKEKEQQQTKNNHGGGGGGGGVSGGGGGGAAPKKGQTTEKKKGNQNADALSLDKLWIEVQWLKRNKLDIAEFMRLRKGGGGGGGSIDIQEQNENTTQKKDGAKKGKKAGTESNSILQNLAMHFQYELSKSSSAGSVQGKIGVGNYDYQLEDAVRDLKIAMVDTASAVKDLKERVAALEENRKIDMAQLNEKWNNHQRKISKLEKLVNGVVKQNERLSASFIQSGLLKALTSGQVTINNLNNDEKEISATREKLNILKKSLGDSYGLGGEDNSPTNKNYLGVNLIDKNNSSRSSNSNRRIERNSNESMQAPYINQQYYTEDGQGGGKQGGKYHNPLMTVTMPQLQYQQDNLQFKLPPYQKKSIPLMQQLNNAQNQAKLPQSLNHQSPMHTNYPKLLDEDKQMLNSGSNFVLPHTTNTMKSNGFNASSSGQQDLTHEILGKNRGSHANQEGVGESRNNQTMTINNHNHNLNSPNHRCSNCGCLQPTSKTYYSGKNSPGRVHANTQHVERHRKARFYGIDFLNKSPIDSIPKDSKQISMLNRINLPNGKKLPPTNHIPDISKTNSSFHPATRAYAAHVQMPSIGFIEQHQIEESSLMHEVEYNQSSQEFQNKNTSGQGSPKQLKGKPGSLGVNQAQLRQTQTSQFKIGTAASIKAGMSRNTGSMHVANTGGDQNSNQQTLQNGYQSDKEQ